MDQNFPELQGKVTGDNFPPPPIAELLLKLLNVVQMLGLIVVFLGDRVFYLVGFSQAPAWFASVQKNGMQLAIFLYLLLPNILSKYLITGAFEVILDGQTIFSKLETGRLPQFGDLVTPLLKAGLKQVTQ
jgi:selT/selW/selH-like putative selenoprotein